MLRSLSFNELSLILIVLFEIILRRIEWRFEGEVTPLGWAVANKRVCEGT
jgi:hypothetical protein